MPAKCASKGRAGLLIHHHVRVVRRVMTAVNRDSQHVHRVCRDPFRVCLGNDGMHHVAISRCVVAAQNRPHHQEKGRGLDCWESLLGCQLFDKCEIHLHAAHAPAGENE